jgi:predicted Zn-dependent protease
VRQTATGKVLRFAIPFLAVGLLANEAQAALVRTAPNPGSCSACLRASDPDACHAVAMRLAAGRQWDQAIDIEEQIHERQPMNAVVAAALADMYQDSRRNLPRAIALYHAALHASPGFPPALLGLGIVMQHHGEMEIAARYYARAARESPDDPNVKVRLAEVLVKTGREGEAQPILAEIVARWPRTPEADAARKLLPKTALARP